MIRNIDKYIEINFANKHYIDYSFKLEKLLHYCSKNQINKLFKLNNKEIIKILLYSNMLTTLQINSIINNIEFAFIIAENLKLTDNQINDLLKLNNEEVNKSLCQNARITRKQRNILFDKFKDDRINSIYLVRYRHLDSQQIDFYLSKKDIEIWRDIAQYSYKFNYKQFYTLVSSDDDDILYYLSINTNLTKQQALLLASNENLGLNSLLTNSSLSDKIKEKLIEQSVKKTVFK